MSDNLDDACENLRLGLDKVRVNRSRADKILRPCQREDFESIMGFTLYDKKSDRELFNKWMVDTPNRTAHRIQAKGKNSVLPRSTGGKGLHGVMSNGIAHLDSKGSKNTAPKEERLFFNYVHRFLKDNFKVSLLPAFKEVTLRGFIYRKDEDSSSKLNCWDGRADAIGLLKGKDGDKYVIVEWKRAGKTLNAVWENKPSRDYFTQCLVYARLLKLHLSLDYLPPILIVPFNSECEYMHPRLYTDYPDQFKEAIEEYEWSTNPQKFKKESPLKDTVKEDLPQLKGSAQDVPVQQPFLRQRQAGLIPLPVQLNEEFPKKYELLKVTELRKEVIKAVRSDGRSRPNWGNPASSPYWWPLDIPYVDVNNHRPQPRKEHLLAILNAFKNWKYLGGMSPDSNYLPQLKGSAQDVPVQQPFLRQRQAGLIPLPVQLNEEFPKKYELLKVTELRKEVIKAVRSDGRSRPNWGNPASSPYWWPLDIPYVDVNNHRPQPRKEHLLAILNAFKNWKYLGGVSPDSHCN
ncbi:uncharacterized protein [Acropora muricata]|uniref:uncharacterized protein n=1 Tax=Acropora muricata TaxID=159855 RepID=UPI0034E4A5FC